MVRVLTFIVAVCSAGSLHLRADDREWPFTAVRETVPAVSSPWVRNDIDRFVLRELQKHNLSPAKEANRHHLIRRLYFDLIGLPPTPEAVADFVEDKSPDAWEKVVDRLLADPRYGERWARFWLDLARYADTAGYEGDPDLPHAWRYRDYVIDAFNNDKPYDQFIREQIAGDEFAEVMGAGELPLPSAEQTVALTFLRLAPFTEPRGDETRHELLSEMTSTVGSVFLGLTVGCAKCHDHKYDDIPTRDFYRLKAFFSTVAIPPPARGDGFQIGGSLPAAFYRPNEQKWAQAQVRAAQREKTEAARELENLRNTLEGRLRTGSGFGLQAMGGGLGNNYIFGRTKTDDGKMHVSIVNCDSRSWSFFTDNVPESGTGSNAGSNLGQWFGDIAEARHLFLGQYSEGTGEVATPGAHHVGEFLQILIYDHPLGESERSRIGKWMDGQADGPPRDGLRLWFDASDLDGDDATANPIIDQPIARWTDRISGQTIRQTDPDRQPKLVRVNGSAVGVRFDDDFMTGSLSQATFTQDQRGAIVVAYTARHHHEGYGFEVGGNGQFITTFVNPTAAARESIGALADANDPRLTPGERRRFRELSEKPRFLQQRLKRLQPVAMSLRHSFGPPYEPGVPTSRIMIRGEYDQPGEVVTAGFPECVTGDAEPAEIRLDPFKRWPTRSRRMALADWIASPRNPLTARVLVNRLWYWHFGRGIVATPSDFGQLSGGPSHPELLDWLASRLVRGGWRMKSVHKHIVMSATYRQTSLREDRAAAEADPDNRLLWRFRRRRLEAEAIRDSVLSVSGRLNYERYGLPIFPPLPDDIERRVRYSESKWDTQHGPEGRKRSIYIYQQRTLNMPFMQSFDAVVCDESRPRRRHSITPLQALAMYNGSFVSGEATHFADRVRKDVGQAAEEQVVHAFLLALGRAPTNVELERLVPMARQGQLEGICRVLLNCNEFIFID